MKVSPLQMCMLNQIARREPPFEEARHYDQRVLRSLAIRSTPLVVPTAQKTFRLTRDGIRVMLSYLESNFYRQDAAAPMYGALQTMRPKVVQLRRKAG